MNRRHFLSACLATLSAAALRANGIPATSGVLKNSALRFGIITDLHPDIMPDAVERLQSFMITAAKEQLDFIIDLGDFSMVKPQNVPMVNLFNSFEGEKYHVVGNHDMDNCTKFEFMQFVGMKKRFYSFVKGDFRFLVLDANNLCIKGEYIPYKNGNFYVDSKQRAFIDPEQKEWLKRELRLSPQRCVIFSHQSLENTVGNKKEIQALLEQTNKEAGYQKVVVAFSGHDHTNYEKEINGITYIQINSASNQWVGGDYQCTERYDEATNAKYPSVRYTTPYMDSLYAIVTLGKKQLSIQGKESSFMPPTPHDLTIPADLHGIPLVPYIKDFRMKF